MKKEQYLLKNWILFGLLLLTGVRCSSKSDALYPANCASSQPMLTGKWALVEFRYFGGCCPVIADSSWKKAEVNAYFVEFTADKKLKVLNNTTGVGNNFAAAAPAQTITNYSFDGKEITLDEQILGGATWNKKIGVSQLTTNELTLHILVGKEGETNARKFVRTCQ